LHARKTDYRVNWGDSGGTPTRQETGRRDRWRGQAANAPKCGGGPWLVGSPAALGKKMIYCSYFKWVLSFAISNPCLVVRKQEACHSDT
jgi:hypothetical protein